ncbi:MAG TPA: type I-E CRISPR-associated protein Cas5/CasD, partial [Anaerolineae bacterium]|nr:type I-E CRISPR-associated protein Cas5/CasD [Anaerolineae bacterium]
KSGVIGLIACALGYREDDQIRPLSQKTRMGARVDAPGRLITDYHTIGGGYDYPALLTAAGKPKKSSGKPHTEISRRDYLCDASFLVALQLRETADAPLIAQMARALQNPVWPLYLGRKSCPPAAPVFAGTGSYPDLQTALTNYPGFTRYRRPRRQPFTCRMELEADRPVGTRRRDNVYSRRFRLFHPRYTAPPDNSPVFVLKEEDDHVSLQIAAE